MKLKHYLIPVAIILLSPSAHSQNWLTTGNAGTDTLTKFIGTTDNVPLKIKTNGANRMIVLTNGRIGMGTVTPQFNLDVTNASGAVTMGVRSLTAGATVSMDRGLASANAAFAYKSLSTTLWNTGILGNDNYTIRNVAGSNNVVVITPSNKVGIGTATPSDKLEVSGGSISTDGIYKISNNSYLWHPGTNAVLGYGAFNNTATGTNNTMLGDNSGSNITTGNYNTFGGNGSGGLTADGSFNAFFGYNCGKNNSSGGNNTFAGGNSGFFNNTGQDNSFFGNASCQSNSSGSNNVAVGSAAGFNNSTGSYNTYLGYSANCLSGALSNATAIGSFAKVSASNSIILGDTNNIKVGIGITAPIFRLDVRGGSINVDSMYRLNSQTVLWHPNNNLVAGSYSYNASSTGFRNLILGDSAGRSNTTGYANVFAGWLSGNSNTIGAHNSYFGVAAGSSNSTGSDNTYVGTNAGYYTTGFQNSFFGSAAGITITGNYNTAMGVNSGSYSSINPCTLSTFLGYGAIATSSWTNATAIGANATVQASNAVVLGNNANVGIGIGAPVFKLHVVGGSISADSCYRLNGIKTLFHPDRSIVAGWSSYNDASTGYRNTIIGDSSGYSNTTGFSNTFVGFQSGIANNAGDHNAFFGAGTGASNTGGIYNTYLGANSGFYNQNGNYNTVAGAGALFVNTGSSNVAVGVNAGMANTSGNSNTFIGTNSNCGSNNLANATAIGFNTSVDTSNALILGNGANVGIGISKPKAKLHISADSSTPVPTLLLSETANDFARINFQNTNTTNYFAVAGYPASTTVASKLNFYYSGFGDIMTVEGDGNVGIGITAPTFQLQLSNNSAAKPTSSTWTVASDERLKKNISDFTDGMNVIEKINPVWYEYNGMAGMPTDERSIGTIAQDLQKIAPYMVREWTYKKDDQTKGEQYLGVDYHALFFVLVNAVKETKTENEILKTEVETLKDANQTQQQKMDALIERMNQLESTVNDCCSKTSDENKSSNHQVINSSNKAELLQNNPNPFKENTTIQYNISVAFVSAVIVIEDSKGNVVNRIEIKAQGNGSIIISGGTLQQGVYTYSLIVDGKIEATRKMILTK